MASGVPVAANDAGDDPRRQLALMGTIPIYWGEADGLVDLLADNGHRHWARPVLERQFRLAPLDYLSAEALAGHDLLLLAQPRALSPQENVALDSWVRAGGRLLLFADPMMTGHSRFSLGDRRRPQDVALLSPILGHWGVRLVFDEAQAEGLHLLAIGQEVMPVNLPGRFETAAASPCHVSHGGIIATCRIERGWALLVADAAILDLAGPHEGAEASLAALARLLAGQGGETGELGENAGTPGAHNGPARKSPVNTSASGPDAPYPTATGPPRK